MNEIKDCGPDRSADPTTQSTTDFPRYYHGIAPALRLNIIAIAIDTLLVLAAVSPLGASTIPYSQGNAPNSLCVSSPFRCCADSCRLW